MNSLIKLFRKEDKRIGFWRKSFEFLEILAISFIKRETK